MTRLEVTETFWRCAGSLICAATLIGLACTSPSMAQSDAASTAKPSAPTLTKEEVDALSNLNVALKKAPPTAVSGVTVSARRSTSVSELTVSVPLCPPINEHPDADTKPPKLLSSYPGNGAVVRPGIVILRLTFDKPMSCIGLLDNRKGYPNPCPAPLQEPLFSRDRRTFLTVCVIEPDPYSAPAEGSRISTSANGFVIAGQTFGLRLDRFTSLSGRPFKPSDFEFTVDVSARPVENLREAMAQDRFLRDAQKAAEKAQ